MLRIPVLIAVVSLLLLQFVHGVSPCCHGEDSHEDHAHTLAAAGEGDATLEPSSSDGDRHHDDRGSCTCVCHGTVAAVTGQPVLGDRTAELLPRHRPHVVLPLGHLLTSKPPPRG